jgi:hypothetical protein
MAVLVAVGDSLVQGAQSLSSERADLSFPSLIARCLGLGAGAFAVPDLSGAGGLPFNLERMMRRLARDFGERIRGPEWLAAAVHIGRMLDEVEDYWERGQGAAPQADALYHNLGIWGFQVCDAYTTTPRRCDGAIARDKPEWLEPPSHGRLRVARRVLNPARLDARQDDTQLEVARRIAARDGGIDHLVALVGANNCLRAVWDLEIRETGPASPGPGTGSTLWSKSAFAEEYARFADGLSAVGAHRVHVGTVPHVSGLPLSRGVMRNRDPWPPGGGYFDFYARAWIDPAQFDERRDPHLRGDEMRRIDERIDAFNESIRAEALGRGFTVVDVATIFDGLDWFKHHGAPPFPLPPAIGDLDTRFFEIDESGARTEGGLISLDGMHPTSCGYGLVAQAFVDAIRDGAPAIADVDFGELRNADELVSSPPRTLCDVYGMLETLEKRFHLSRWLSLEDDHGIGVKLP